MSPPALMARIHSMAWAPGRPQRAPVMPIRSWTRWRQAPSMTPVAIGQPFARARGLVQVGLLGGQVVQGLADDLGVLAAGPRRVVCGKLADPGDDLGGAAAQGGRGPGGR